MKYDHSFHYFGRQQLICSNSLFNIQIKPEPTMERSTLLTTRCFKEMRPLSHPLTTTYSSLSSKIYKEIMKLQARKIANTWWSNSTKSSSLKVCRLESKCSKYLSFSNEGLITPIKFQNPYLLEDSEFIGYDLRGSINDHNSLVVATNSLPLAGFTSLQ